MLTKSIIYPKHVPNYTKDIINGVAFRHRLWANQNYKRFNMNRNMTGMCGIITGRILRALEARGIKNFYAGISKDVLGSHVFAISKDLIIDVTATQFGEEEICILPSDGRTEWYWKPFLVLHDADSLIRWQHENEWGHQCAETIEQIKVNGNSFCFKN